MNIIITGAAGFIGSHLVDRFLKEGHNVAGVDNCITGRMANLEHINSDRFRFIKADVTCDDFEPGFKPDGILHFASPASPVDFPKIPLEILDANSIGTRRCLDMAKKHGARFLMASTSEVYGDPLVHPQVETYFGNVNPRGVRSVYDESKRFAEAQIYAYKRMYDMDVRVVRVFNTYGPRMRIDDGRVVPVFVGQALTGKPLTVFGDGSQTRSFTYVDDEVEGIYRLFNSNYTEPVNIGNPYEFTIMEMISVMEEVIGKKLNVVYKPLPPDDPVKRKPDITLAREILDWNPKINLEEGLKNTIEWYKKQEVQF